MEATVPEAAAVERGGVASTPTTPLLQSRKNQKRRRRSSGGAWEGRRTSKRSKKSKTEVSSTHAANNIMKFRLGGSVSDPLNLLGGDDLGDTCSTCTPSPATPIYKELEVPDLPPQLMKDPLNLEEKVKNFPQSGKRRENRSLCGCEIITLLPFPVLDQFRNSSIGVVLLGTVLMGIVLLGTGTVLMGMVLLGTVLMGMLL